MEILLQLEGYAKLDISNAMANKAQTNKQKTKEQQ